MESRSSAPASAKIIAFIKCTVEKIKKGFVERKCRLSTGCIIGSIPIAFKCKKNKQHPPSDSFYEAQTGGLIMNVSDVRLPVTCLKSVTLLS